MVSMKEALCMPADCDGAMELRRGLDLEEREALVEFQGIEHVSMA